MANDLSRSQKTSLVRCGFTKQSSGCSYHGQACTQCCNVAFGRVCLQLSGRGRLQCQARARSVRTQQLGGFAYHCQACAQCYNAAAGCAYHGQAARSVRTQQSGGGACSVRTQQSAGFAYHAQACAPCCDARAYHCQARAQC